MATVDEKTSQTPTQRKKLGCVQISAMAGERIDLTEIGTALEEHRQERARIHYVTLWAGGGDDYLISDHASSGGVKFRISRNLSKGVTTVRLACEC